LLIPATVLTFSLIVTPLQLFVAIIGTSRILQQLLSNTSEDDSDLGVVNKMVVTELLNQGQSLDVILDCLKVCSADLVEHVFVIACKNYRLLINVEFAYFMLLLKLRCEQ